MELFKILGRVAVDNDEANKNLDETGDKASSLGNKLKSGLGTAAKVGAAAVAAAGTAVVALAKSSIAAYADYEQLVGGVETLFGTGGKNIEEYAESVGKTVAEVEAEYNSLMAAQSSVMDNAANAYMSAGMSANQYMETVTSFSASLIQSLGGDTAAAAEYSDMAITDMADNANKMGTSIDSIVQTYQSLSRGNFAMLDNLKLGYGGTKEELERLLKDADALSESFDLATDKNGDLVYSYADIVDAIHIIQTDMGITGTTAREASETISGSVSSMKGAWQNMLVGIADDSQDFDSLVGNLVSSVSTVAANIMPRITVALQGVGQLITSLAPVLIAGLPSLVSELLPELINAAMSIVDSLVAVIPSLVTSLFPSLLDAAISLVLALSTALPELFQSLVDVLPTLIDSLVEALPTLIPALILGVTDCIIALIDFIATYNWLDLIIKVGEALIAAIPVLLESLNQIWESIKTAFTNAWNQIVAVVAPIIENLKVAAAEKFAEIKENISTKIEEIKSNISDKFTAAKETVTGIFDSIKTAISEKIEAAKTAVSNAIDKIKGFFKFEWSLPSIKLPHFTQIGTTALGLPKIGIEWYAKGGIMEEPTAFGINPNNGKVMVGGEAGAEAIAPISTLQGYVSAAVAGQNAVMVSILEQILEAIIALDDNMGGNLRAALAGTRFNINEREFARLVKAVG